MSFIKEFFIFIMTILSLFWVVSSSFITICVLTNDRSMISADITNFPVEVTSVKKTENGYEYNMDSKKIHIRYKSNEVYQIGSKFDLINVQN